MSARPIHTPQLYAGERGHSLSRANVHLSPDNPVGHVVGIVILGLIGWVILIGVMSL